MQLNLPHKSCHRDLFMRSCLMHMATTVVCARTNVCQLGVAPSRQEHVAALEVKVHDLLGPGVEEVQRLANL